jgi:hypothetical protein
MAKWCCEFDEGSSDVHDEIRSGRPPIVTDEIIQNFMKTFMLTDV